MKQKLPFDPQQVKNDSERLIIDAGGKICDWLPWIDRTGLRSRDDIVRRSLILNAMLNIYFKAPVSVVRDWIERNGLAASLSNVEQGILAKANDALSKQEQINLYWYVECLWAFLWVGSIIDELPLTSPVEDRMASLCPNLQKNEDGAKFSQCMRLRSHEELYRMLDRYYRAHWYARDGQLNRYDTGAFNIDIIMERRRALEWALNSESDWNEVDMST